MGEHPILTFLLALTALQALVFIARFIFCRSNCDNCENYKEKSKDGDDTNNERNIDTYNERRFAQGFKRGQESILRKNKSGCTCIIDDNDMVVSACAAHFYWMEVNRGLKNGNV